MGLKAFFIMRFVAIATISLITHYFVLPLIPLPAPLEPEPVWWLITGVCTILIMLSAYRSLGHAEAEPDEIVHRLSDFPGPEAVLDEVKKRHQIYRTPLEELPRDTTIKEVGSHRVVVPEKKRRKPSKAEIERTLYSKLLERIENASVNVSAKVAKDGDNKLTITELEATLDTQNPPPQKPWQPRRVRRGG